MKRMEQLKNTQFLKRQKSREKNKWAKQKIITKMVNNI